MRAGIEQLKKMIINFLIKVVALFYILCWSNVGISQSTYFSGFDIQDYSYIADNYGFTSIFSCQSSKAFSLILQESFSQDFGPFYSCTQNGIVVIPFNGKVEKVLLNDFHMIDNRKSNKVILNYNPAHPPSLGVQDFIRVIDIIFRDLYTGQIFEFELVPDTNMNLDFTSIRITPSTVYSENNFDYDLTALNVFVDSSYQKDDADYFMGHLDDDRTVDPEFIPTIMGDTSLLDSPTIMAHEIFHKFKMDDIDNFDTPGKLDNIMADSDNGDFFGITIDQICYINNLSTVEYRDIDYILNWFNLFRNTVYHKSLASLDSIPNTNSPPLTFSSLKIELPTTSVRNLNESTKFDDLITSLEIGNKLSNFVRDKKTPAFTFLNQYEDEILYGKLNKDREKMIESKFGGRFDYYLERSKIISREGEKPISKANRGRFVEERVAAHKNIRKNNLYRLLALSDANSVKYKTQKLIEKVLNSDNAELFKLYKSEFEKSKILQSFK